MTIYAILFVTRYQLLTSSSTIPNKTFYEEYVFGSCNWYVSLAVYWGPVRSALWRWNVIKEEDRGEFHQPRDNYRKPVQRVKPLKYGTIFYLDDMSSHFIYDTRTPQVKDIPKQKSV